MSQESQLEITGSRNVIAWMDEQQVSLAFTTYKADRLFLFGRDPAARLSISEWRGNRCLGLWCDGRTLWVSTQTQLWRMENAVAPGGNDNGWDGVFAPRLTFLTGDLDVHDIVVEESGRVLFANTMYSCVAVPGAQHSFHCVWKPPFIGRLAGEDRCHLNGFALENGKPAYVTFVGAADVADGWRPKRRDGGSIMDVRTNGIVADGFSMPHSPRVYRDRLWVLDSGNGRFGFVDRARGRFEEVTFCPGYSRGLSFVGKYAVVGLSRPRDNVSFAGLALDEQLAKRGAEARCGLFVIDLDSGDTVHWLQLGGLAHELYDVAILPGVRRPRFAAAHEQVVSIGPNVTA